MFFKSMTLNENFYIYLAIFAMFIILLLIMYFFLNATNRKNKVTKKEIEKLNVKMEDFLENNEKSNQISKQIKDKSEVISKILEQTNDIYREILNIEKESENEIKLGDINEKEIDFSQVEKANVLPGKHLSNLISDINEDSEMVDKEVKTTTEQVETKLAKEELEEEEVLNLINNIQEYESFLSEELKYYLNEINLINENKNELQPKQRLEKKEEIYKNLKVTEEKIIEQKNLMKRIFIHKVDLDAKKQECEELENEEHKLDDMINNLINKR